MGRFSVRVATMHCIAVRQSVMGLPLQKFVCNQFDMYTLPQILLCLPKTLLFINLKKSFRKLLLADERCWVLKSI